LTIESEFRRTLEAEQTFMAWRRLREKFWHHYPKNEGWTFSAIEHFEKTAGEVLRRVSEAICKSGA
jgi:hypothetical protein